MAENGLITDACGASKIVPRSIEYEGYRIWPDGRITNAAGKVMAQHWHETRNGRYRRVQLTKDKRRKWYRVNRLVCAAFHGPPPTDKHQARHLDGDTANNAASNLAWGTPLENYYDQVVHGTANIPPKQRHHKEAVKQMRNGQ